MIRATFNEKEVVVLRYLAKRDTTVDEYLTKRGDLYVNSWAPTFTRLLNEGILERTGEKRRTRNGGSACVHRIVRKHRDTILKAIR